VFLPRICKLHLGARRAAAAVSVIAVSGALFALSSNGPVASAATAHESASSAQLIIDTQFDSPAGDPNNNSSIVNYYMLGLVYDTLLTYTPNAAGHYDLAKPQPWLATSYSSNANATVFTFHLRHNVVFSDGTPLTSKDVVFSLLRVTNLKGAPSFVGACFKKVTATSTYTVQITTNAPCPGLPSDLTTKSAGIVNSAVVIAHGGTDAADASTKDKAGPYFNNHSLGSGPYVLQSFSPTGQTVLVRNPKFWGPKPFYAKLIYENVTPAIARLNVLDGQAQIAIGLSADQTSTLSSNPAVQVKSAPSSTVFYLQANANPKVNALAANPDLWQALRYAINYSSLDTVVGAGTAQACGVVPTLAFGALPQSDCVKTNLTVAKHYASLAHVAGKTLTLEFPTEFSLDGASFETVAEALQGDLTAAGIKTTLDGTPLATWLPRWEKGIQQLNVGALAPSYVDPSQMLAYAPTGYRGQYAGMTAGSLPAVQKAANAAADAVGTSARKAAYANYQKVLNDDSPIIPLFDPVVTVVAAKGISGVTINPEYIIDPALFAAG
jgi:peptide/nickel transport system substrate-binding protein